MACGPNEVCGDVESSLVAQWGDETVTVEWTTDSESSNVSAFKVYRDKPGTRQLVTGVPATGTCGTSKTYSAQDSPPTPTTQWGYEVEVINQHNTVVCCHRTEPVAAGACAGVSSAGAGG